MANTFGNVVDYFGLASAALKPIFSDAGDSRQRICVSHTGDYESGVGQTSGVWRNPTVTYAISANCTFSATLGKAFAAQTSGIMTVSGYMITRLRIETNVGNFPTITVSAVANEGADAINTYPFSCQLLARSKAQNLMGALSSLGKLFDCTLEAKCEPIVIAENMMPCASDVVHGRIEVTATTVSPNDETAPTAQNGFTLLGQPKATTERNWTAYRTTAVKEL